MKKPTSTIGRPVWSGQQNGFEVDIYREVQKFGRSRLSRLIVRIYRPWNFFKRGMNRRHFYQRQGREIFMSVELPYDLAAQQATLNLTDADLMDSLPNRLPPVTKVIGRS